MSIVILRNRRSIRPAVITGGITGDYSSTRRYVPLFTLPAGVTYNPATGLCEGNVLATSYTPSGNEVLLADQGSEAANYALLQTTITNAGSDAVRIRLANPTTSWGDGLKIPVHNRVGVGMSIEPAGVKDGTVSLTGRATKGGSGYAKFRFARSHAWGAPPGGNQILRSIFEVTPGTSNVQFNALDLAYDPTWAATIPDLTSAGSSGDQGTAAGLISTISDVTSGYVDRITVRHCSVQGQDGKPLLRGVYLNGTNVGILDTWFDNIHYKGNDSQCFLTTDGAGPFQIENCYMSIGYGEAWMIGGGNTASFASVAHNILIRRNHFDFPSRYVGRGYELKNLSEFKEGYDALYERNLLTGARMTGYDGQNYALVAKVVAQPYYVSGVLTPGPDTWNVLKRITIRLNEIRDCEQAFGIGADVGVDEFTDSIQFAQNRIVFTDYVTPTPRNTPGASIQITTRGASDAQSQKNFRCNHNTISAPKSANAYRRMIFDTADATSGRVIGLKVYGNAMVTEEPLTNLAGDPPTVGGYLNRNAGAFNANSAWNSFTDKVNCEWGSNAIVGPSVQNASLIPGDVYHESKTAAGLTTFRHRLATGSPLLTGDADGGMQGCNHTLLDAALAGVEAV